MNNQIFYFFYSLAHKSILLDKIIIFLAQTFPYLVITGAVIFLLFHHEIFYSKEPIRELKQKWKEIVLVFFSGIFAWCLAYILKILVHTPRPFIKFTEVHNLITESGFAFPSGHATFFMALGVVIYFSHKKVGYLFILFALLIGLARIAAGVHFPIDILGGFILGKLTAYLINITYKKFKK